MNTLHVKKGDTAVVLSGKQKGKKGKIISVSPKKGQVVIEGVNMLTTHVKPRRQGESGGIVKREGAIRACKVMAVCPKCDKPTRQAHKFLEDEKKTKVRVCKHCGEVY
ncbi:MAG: 50S ribosomal protein L24 [Clostridia bacterium]|nr:50S ribosomal protein L24 [Clostridia bacterium]